MGSSFRNRRYILRYPIIVAAFLVSVLTTACNQSATSPTSSSGNSSSSSVQAPVSGTGALTTTTWQRPAAVAPLEAQGKFQVISEDQWPGDKVRVFFWGVQG